MKKQNKSKLIMKQKLIKNLEDNLILKLNWMIQKKLKIN